MSNDRIIANMALKCNYVQTQFFVVTFKIFNLFHVKLKLFFQLSYGFVLFLLLFQKFLKLRDYIIMLRLIHGREVFVTQLWN